MKWPEALQKPTRQYTGGILAGLGLGLLVSEMIARRTGGSIPWTVAFLVGFALIAIGSTLARAGQRGDAMKNRPANKPSHHTTESRAEARLPAAGER